MSGVSVSQSIDGLRAYINIPSDAEVRWFVRHLGTDHGRTTIPGPSDMALFAFVRWRNADAREQFLKGLLPVDGFDDGYPLEEPDARALLGDASGSWRKGNDGRAWVQGVAVDISPLVKSPLSGGFALVRDSSLVLFSNTF